MKPHILVSKDFWAGAMLIAVGAAAMFIARAYPFGSTLRMGPGYFPVVLGGVLVLFGLVLMTRSIKTPERIAPGWSLRALIVLPLAFAAFGFLMDRIGFVPALAVLIAGSAAASPSFRWIEVAALTVALTLVCVGIFIWGLGLPYKLVAGF